MMNRGKGMATIKDVAKEAGVSTATVSRVLNGNYPVSDEAYDGVMKAIESLGYRPNAIAKSLKMNRTYMIGLVVPDISNPYFMEIARGLEQGLGSHGYNITFCSTDEDPEKEIKLLRALNERRVDCVFLASCQDSHEALMELMQQGLNLIMVDTYLEGLPVQFVIEDNVAASQAMVEYAIKKGHKEIAIVNGIMSISTAKDRYEGFERALMAHKLNVNPVWVLQGGYYREIAKTCVTDFLKDNRKLPSLIYATNNQMTEGTLIALKQMGLKVPEDISVISYGNVALHELVEPSITHVHQDAKAIGEKAAEVFLKVYEKGGLKAGPVIHLVDYTLKDGRSLKAL